MAELKTKENDASVDAFLESIADEQRRKDGKQLRQLFEEITKEPARMWGSSIIGFGSRHLKYASGRELDWMLTGFSPRKDSLTLYILDSYKLGGHKDDLDRLGPHKTGKGCLYIKRLSDVDLKVLRELITKSFEHAKSGGFLQ